MKLHIELMLYFESYFYCIIYLCVFYFLQIDKVYERIESIEDSVITKCLCYIIKIS